MSLELPETAARAIDFIRRGQGSIKTFCFDGKVKVNKKALYGSVCECCKNFYALQAAIRSCPSLTEAADAPEYFWMMLLLELSNGKFRYDLNDKRVQKFWSVKGRLLDELATAKKRFPPFEESFEKFKFMRVNRLIDADELPESFVQVDSERELEKNERGYMWDAVVKDLLLLSPNCNISLLPGHRNGSLISQDKASCIPAFILAPPPGAHVIDCCAAPGNKTTQLAAMVGTDGRVFAIEKDCKRFEVLRKMVKRAGADSIVECHNRDFLSLDPSLPKYRAVEYALVDPSCSGSGMPLSLEKHVESGRNDKNGRIEHLANFQAMAVKQAMKFPAVKAVVYSTCSVNERENEAVVAEVLHSMVDWSLAGRPLPGWTRRGLSSYDFAEDVIRADPQEDRMTGFFVALFVKNG